MAAAEKPNTNARPAAMADQAERRRAGLAGGSERGGIVTASTDTRVTRDSGGGALERPGGAEGRRSAGGRSSLTSGEG
jgi:hypothetical protein